jgi:hypothetical protein
MFPVVRRNRLLGDLYAQLYNAQISLENLQKQKKTINQHIRHLKRKINLANIKQDSKDSDMGSQPYGKDTRDEMDLLPEYGDMAAVVEIEKHSGPKLPPLPLIPIPPIPPYGDLGELEEYESRMSHHRLKPQPHQPLVRRPSAVFGLDDICKLF